MTIRRATLEDVVAIVVMGLRFQATTSYATHLRATAETLTALVNAMLANPDAAGWLAEREGVPVGMIGAALYTNPMSGERVGSEIVWWMEPEARGGRTALRLIRTAEQWAQEHGAVIFQLMAPTTEVGRFYQALKYDAIEVHYQRRLA